MFSLSQANLKNIARVEISELVDVVSFPVRDRGGVFCFSRVFVHLDEGDRCHNECSEDEKAVGLYKEAQMCSHCEVVSSKKARVFMIHPSCNHYITYHFLPHFQ